jgi:hypothetical protein
MQSLKSAALFEAVCQVVLKKKENFARILQVIDLLKYGTGEKQLCSLAMVALISDYMRPPLPLTSGEVLK